MPFNKRTRPSTTTTKRSRPSTTFTVERGDLINLLRSDTEADLLLWSDGDANPIQVSGLATLFTKRTRP